MLERGLKYGLDYYETKDRAYTTIRTGKIANRKHSSGRYSTYYRYFNDNMSFYVICRELRNQVLIKTVIIEEGKE